MLNARQAREKSNTVLNFAADQLLGEIDKEVRIAVDHGEYECVYTLQPQHCNERIINKALSELTKYEYKVQHNADNGTITLNWEG